MLFTIFIVLSLGLKGSKSELIDSDVDVSSKGPVPDDDDEEEYYDKNIFKFNFNHQCYSNNTHLVNGMCVCKEGFISDNPSDNGCWRCVPKCHPKAICEQDSKCHCILGYFGNGTNCVDDPPHILNLSHEKCKVNEPCLFDITYNIYSTEEHIIDIGYCKIGKNIVRTFDISPSNIRFKYTFKSMGRYPVSVSLDNGTWSQEQIVIIFFVKLPPISIEQIIVILLFISLIVSLVKVAHMRWQEMNSFGKMPEHSVFLSVGKSKKKKKGFPNDRECL